jgi:tetratricopeptide (TPR) repeat protein
MPDAEDIAQQQGLLAAHRRTLAVYLRQLADLGSQYAPPGVHNGIADERAAIAQIKATLRGWGEVVEDQPGDEETPREREGHGTAATPGVQGSMDVSGRFTGSTAGVNYGSITTNIYQGGAPSPDARAVLAHAEALLATMPLDTIPDLAPALPSGSRMPLSRNPLFVGRQADLKAIAATLRGGTTAAIGQVAAATGLGGIGKTNLATEFVHRYSQFFAGGVFWLSFAEAANVPAEVAACGGPSGLDLPGFEALKQEEQIARVRQAWQSPLPRLLVFDNCEDEALLKEWRPASGGCRVLVTSRRQRWSRALGVDALHLGVLRRAESIALLRKHRPDLADVDAEAIASALGDHPLALHLAGSYLEVYADDPAFGDPTLFLSELQDERLLEHPALKGEEVSPSPTNHALHAGKTFALSYERLKPNDPVDMMAIALLARAAHLAPNEPIPRELLLATLKLDEDDREGARQAARALTRLVSLGLLETEEERALRLHGLLVAFVRQTVDDEEAQADVEQAVLAVAVRINQAGYPGAMQAILVHLRSVTAASLDYDSVESAALCNELGYLLDTMGDYTGARPYYERALVINEQVLGASHPDTATSWNNLGYLLREMGDYTGAQPYFERALQIREQVLEANHPAMAQSLNNMGALLRAMGNHVGARPYYERALAIHQQELGATHSDTARSLNNLGNLLLEMGDFGEAQPYLEQALQIREHVRGANHPDTATSLNNLGHLLHQMDDLQRARPYLERALTIRQAMLGEGHPDTATTLNNLADLYASMGQFDVAIPLLERALSIRSQALGAQHPDTLVTQRSLDDQHIADITVQADNATAEALADPSSDRVALAAQLAERAQQAEKDKWEGSPYLALAAHLRALAARLAEGRGGDA